MYGPPGVEEAKAITPVVGLINKPAVAENVPPVSPVMVGLGLAKLEQYDAEEYEKLALSKGFTVMVMELE